MGIDLAKRIFSLHGVDGSSGVVVRRTAPRDQLMAALSASPPSRIGMEACSARRFQEMGHTVRPTALKFVAPYRKGGKNDRNDAEAILEG